MILSSATLRQLISRGELIINGPQPLNIQPASIEMHLSNRVVRRVGQTNQTTEDYKDGAPVSIRPGEFILASTQETVHIPATLVGQVEGKSSWARRGLLVHVTAGFIDPGFQGAITLEIVNLSSTAIYPRVGQRIAQLAVHRLDREPEYLYGSPQLGSHYQGQTTTTEGAPIE